MKKIKNIYKKIYKINVIFLFIFSYFGQANIFAQDSAVAEFLKLINNPRIVALGGGAFALTDSVVTSNNPSGIVDINQPTLNLTSFQWLIGTSYNFISFILPASFGNFAGSLGYLDYGNIIGRDNDGKIYDIPSSYDTVLLLSYALPIKGTVPISRNYGSFGINLKVLQSKLYNYSTEGIAVDFGGIYIVPFINGLNIGMSVQNIGSPMKFVKEKYSLPLTINLGLKYQHPKLKIMSTIFDLSTPLYDNKNNVFSGGLEISPAHFLDLRLGVNDITTFMDDSKKSKNISSGFAYGLGLKLGNINLNYTFNPFSDLSPVHFIGIEFYLNSFMSPVDIVSASKNYLNQYYLEAKDSFFVKDYITASRKFKDIIEIYPKSRLAELAQLHLNYIESRLNNIMDPEIRKIIYEPGITDKKLLENKQKKIKKEQKKREKISEWLKKAEKFFSEKNILATKKYYNMILDMDPANQDAKDGLEKLNNSIIKTMEGVIKSQKIPPGFSENNKLDERHEKLVAELLKNAKSEFKKGAYTSSKKIFNKILTYSPNNSEVEKYLKEIEERISRISNIQIDELYNLGMDYYEKDNYDIAIKYFEAILLANPERFEIRDLIKRAKNKIAENEANIKKELETNTKEKEQDINIKDKDKNPDSKVNEQDNNPKDNKQNTNIKANEQESNILNNENDKNINDDKKDIK